MTCNFLKKINVPVIRNILEGKFLFLVISLLAYLALAPLLENFLRLRLLLDIFISAVLLSGIYAVSIKKRQRWIATMLAVPLFGSIWLDRFLNISYLTFTSQLLLILFLTFSIICILSFIFENQRVTRDVIYAAVAVYLFIGLLWSDIYSILERLQPGSFNFTQSQTGTNLSDFSYYSFVTLTTLGYGDITPLTAKAKAFAMLEAIIGQLYLVVLIARLVGLHIVHSARKTE